MFGVALLLLGSGLLGTLLALRGGIEGFATTTLGLIMSAYFVGFFAGTYWAPPLIRRIGHIRAFSMFASVASIAAIIHGLWVTPLGWAAGRVVTGICLVGLYTVIESWLNVQATPAQRGRLFALYMAVNLLALAAGQYLILFDDPSRLVLFGLVSILFSAALIPLTLTRIPQPVLETTPRLGPRQLYRIAAVGVVGAFASGVMLGGFWGMGPVMAQQLGFDTTGIAHFMSLTVIGGAALQWPLGLWSDRADRRQVLAVVSVATAFITLLAALLAALMAGPGWPLLLAMLLFGGTSFSLYSISVAHTIDFVKPAEILEASSGMLLVYGIGAALGPTLAGYTMSMLGPQSLLLYFSVIAVVLASFAAWRVRHFERIATHPHPFVAMVRTTPTAMDLVGPENPERAGASPAPGAPVRAPATDVEPPSADDDDVEPGPAARSGPPGS